MTSTDHVNRSAYSGPRVTREFAVTGGPELASWSDPGEQAAIARVADRARGGRILDLGVGGGRTTTLLGLLSQDYLGLDYTPEMVRAAQARHPGVDLRLGDARDLRSITDASVDLVVFSYNGLDSVGHDDRALVLAEIARVLRPGGLVQLSTMNLDGPCARATPLRPAGSHLVHTWSPAYRWAMRLLWLARAPLSVPRARRNVRRLRRSAASGDGWAVAPMEAYDFGLLVHYTTLAAARTELAAVGLHVEAVFDAEFGRPVEERTSLRDVRYFQLVAHRPQVRSR